MTLRLRLYIVSRCAMLPHAMAGSAVRQVTGVQSTRTVYGVLFYSRRQRKVPKASRKHGTAAVRYTRIRQITVQYCTVQYRIVQ